MTKSIIELFRETGFITHSEPPKEFMDALGRFATLHRAAIEKEIENKIFEAAKRHNFTLCKTADGYTLMQLGIVTAQEEI